MKDDAGGRSADRSMRSVLLVAPVAPPYGGMAIQAALLERLLREDGIQAEVLGANQAFSSPWGFFDHIRAVRTCLKTTRFCIQYWRRLKHYELVHVLAASWLHFFLIVSPAVLMARVRGRRIVLNYRAGNADAFLKRCAWITRPVFRMADVNTTPSRFLARVIQHRIGVPVSLVPNIVSVSKFRFRDRLEFQPRMIVTRHLEAPYDVETALRAFRHVQETYPAASLWIAGTGSQEAQLRERTAAWNLANVQFLGNIDHDALPEIYSQRDILLNTSRVDNFPASLLEGSAAGLLVASTNAGGIPFLYQEGKNALLVEVGDWQSLGAKVIEVLRCQEKARALAAAGAELCRAYEWPNVRRALYGVYGFAVESKAERCG